MTTWKAKFYSGATLTTKAIDYFSAKKRIDAIIASCNNKPVLFSLCVVD